MHETNDDRRRRRSVSTEQSEHAEASAAQPAGKKKETWRERPAGAEDETSAIGRRPSIRQRADDARERTLTTVLAPPARSRTSRRSELEQARNSHHRRARPRSRRPASGCEPPLIHLEPAATIERPVSIRVIHVIAIGGELSSILQDIKVAWIGIGKTKTAARQ